MQTPASTGNFQLRFQTEQLPSQQELFALLMLQAELGFARDIGVRISDGRNGSI